MRRGNLAAMDGEQIVREVAEKVRALVDEAEQRAAEIVREAEADAKRIREQAEAEGRQRLDEVRKAFDELQGKLGVGAEVEPGPVTVPEPEPPAVPEPEPPPTPEPSPPDPAPEPEPPTVPEPTPPPDEGTPPSAANGSSQAPQQRRDSASLRSASKSDDAAGARLVAMNMALEGASRDEIVARLEDDYELDDSGAVADEVIALAAK
jgi:outer membrane biosynthesis protein TonB